MFGFFRPPAEHMQTFLLIRTSYVLQLFKTSIQQGGEGMVGVALFETLHIAFDFTSRAEN